MDDCITIDKRVLKALGAETRINILKRLAEKRKTQSQLASDLGMAVPSVKEHLESLQKAELVERVDEGRKWKYYELTRKGRQIITPSEKRVWIVLALSALAVLGSGFELFSKLLQPVQFAQEVLVPRNAGDTFASGGADTLAGGAVPDAAVQTGGVAQAISGAPVETAAEQAKTTLLNETGNQTLTQLTSMIPQIPVYELMLFIASLLALGICVGFLVRKKY